MDKIKIFISYFSDEIKLSLYCSLFFIGFVIYERIFDKYNISSLDRSFIILSIALSLNSFSAMIAIFRHIFKK